MTISANASEVGNATVQVDALVDGPGGATAANVVFLADALGCIGTPQVAIEFGDERAPAIFKPVGADGFHLIMPMTVR